VFGRVIARHAEEDQRAGSGICDRDFQQETSRGLGQHFLAASLAPVVGIGRRDHWLGPMQVAPVTARQTKAMASGANDTRLMYAGLTDAAPCGPNQARA